MQPIHIAAKYGNSDIIKYMLLKSSIKEELAKQVTMPTLSCPIHLAGYDGHYEVPQILLEAQAPLLVKNKFGDTVFHIAIRHNRV